jgi:hypothetical protein
LQRLSAESENTIRPQTGYVEKPKSRIRRFKVCDLLLSGEDLVRWNSLLVPRWIDFVLSAMEDPWHFGNFVPFAQALWSKTFEVKHQVSQNGEPVGFLVSEHPIFEFV